MNASVRCFQSTNSRWTLDEVTKIGRREPRHADAHADAYIPYDHTTFSFLSFEVDGEGYLRKVWLTAEEARDKFDLDDYDGPTFLGCYAEPVLP